MGWTADEEGNLTFVPDGDGGGDTPARAPDGQYDAQGRFYEFIDGQWVHNPIFDKPEATGGTSGPTPSQVTAQGNLAARFAEIEEGRRQFEAAHQLALQEHELAVQQNQRAIAEFNETQQFLRDKLAVEQQAGEKALAEQTALRLQQLAISRANLMQEQAALQSEARMLQAQLQQQTAIFNAQQEAETQRLNEERRVQRSEQVQSVARDVQAAQSDPGDPTALAAYLASANLGDLAGLGQGQDFRTEESLTPLTMLLNLQQTLGQPLDPIQPNLATAPNVPVPEFGEAFDPMAFLNDLASGAAGGGGQQAPRGPVTPVSSAPGSTSTGLVQKSGAPSTGSLRALQEATLAGQQGDTAGQQAIIDAFNAAMRAKGLQTLEDGGMVGDPVEMMRRLLGGVSNENAAIVGDSSDGKENQEMVVGDNFMVIPVPNDSVKGAQKAQDGGVFTTDSTRAFLDQLIGGPSQQLGFGGGVPTPIQVAAPGTFDLFRQQAAGLASTGAGVNRDVFAEIIRRLTPQGVRRGVVGRTA